jgi:hypothetical protein
MPRLSEITDEQQAQVRELWAEGVLRDEIARRMGWKVDFLLRVRAMLELPVRPRYGSRQHVPDPPSQAEIRSLCRQIQTTWSPEETALRSGYPPLTGDARDSIRAHRIISIAECAAGWEQ